MKQKIVRIGALIGLLAFIYIMYKTGFSNIWENIRKVSLWNFAILMLLRLLYWVLRTINWKVILVQYEKNTSLWELFAARMCSHSVSQLTPSAQVGGEAARIYMVHSTNKRLTIASVIVDKSIEFLSVLIFTIFAVGFIFYKVKMPTNLRNLFIVFEIGFAVLVFFLLSKQKEGLIGWIVKILAKIKIQPKYFAKNKDKIEETDAYISDFYMNHRRAFITALLLYSLLIMLWVVEIHITLEFMGVTEFTFWDSFLVTVLGNLAFMFPFVPGMLGVYEATYIAVFALLKKDVSSAFTLVLLRRIIALLWAGLGLFSMIKSFPGKKSKV